MGLLLRKLPLIFIFSFTFALSPAWADGNFLLQNCLEAERLLERKPSEIDVSAGYCIGMVQGVAQTMVFYDLAFKTSGMDAPPTCWPQPLKNQQLVRIVIKYLRDNPANLHAEPHILIMQSLRDAFKCK